MARSKTSICNDALAMLGASSIRDFDENNKRARMADVFYESVKNYLLSKFDWPFAREFKKVQPINSSSMDLPDNLFPYSLPNDCLTPRDLHPFGSKDYWHVIGRNLYCKKDPNSGEDVYLFYTKQVTDATKFSDSFAHLLALGLAVKLCIPITQDKDLSRELKAQYINDQNEAWESDANIGNSYREYDEDPNNDTFVNPDGIVETSTTLNPIIS